VVKGASEKTLLLAASKLLSLGEEPKNWTSELWGRVGGGSWGTIFVP